MINRFIKWLNDNGIRHEVNGAGNCVRAKFSNGYYIRASDFTNDGTCYIRDTGICEHINVFELAERVLYYKSKEKLEQLKDDMRDEIYSGLKDDIINEAIDKATDKKVEDILAKAKNESIDAAKRQLSSTVTTTVTATWNTIKADVKTDLLNKVGTIDVTEIKREAVEKAHEQALGDASKAVDDVVDDIRKKFETRTDAALRKQEERFEKKANESLSGLRDRYQNKLWDQLLSL